MILLIFATLLMIWSWVGLIHSVRKQNDVAFALFMFLAVITTTVSLTDFIMLGQRASEASKMQEKRDYYAELVTHLTDDMSFETVSKTVNTAKDINRDIERNKRNGDHVIYGTFYNKKIGEIELIDIPDLHFMMKDERDL